MTTTPITGNDHVQIQCRTFDEVDATVWASHLLDTKPRYGFNTHFVLSDCHSDFLGVD